MAGCVLSQLKPSELYILSCGKAPAFGLGLSTAKNVELLELYLMHSGDAEAHWNPVVAFPRPQFMNVSPLHGKCILYYNLIDLYQPVRPKQPGSRFNSQCWFNVGLTSYTSAGEQSPKNTTADRIPSKHKPFV